MSRPRTHQDCTKIRATWRRGFTLIEIVTMVGMASLVMTSVAVTISSLHRVNAKLRDEFPAAAAMAGLGLQLRSDAHAARQAKLVTGGDGQSLLRMALTDQRSVEYSAKQERVSRVVLLGDQVERRESFLLSRGSELEWAVGTETIPLVRVTVRSHAGRIPAALDDIRATTIVATVGLDHAEK